MTTLSGWKEKKKLYIYRICNINENDLFVMKFGVSISAGYKTYLVIIYLFVYLISIKMEIRFPIYFIWSSTINDVF